MEVSSTEHPGVISDALKGCSHKITCVQLVAEEENERLLVVTSTGRKQLQSAQVSRHTDWDLGFCHLETKKAAAPIVARKSTTLIRATWYNTWGEEAWKRASQDLRSAFFDFKQRHNVEGVQATFFPRERYVLRRDSKDAEKPKSILLLFWLVSRKT